MATIPEQDAFSLDLQEQIARINRMQVEIGKWNVEMVKTVADAAKIQADIEKAQADTAKVSLDMRLAPRQLAFTGLGAGAALFAAGVAFAKLFVG